MACSKQEIRVQTGNAPAQERPINTELKKNYLNRVFITLLGRKSLDQEEIQYLQILGDSAKRESREIILDSIMQKEDFYYNLFHSHSADILANVDTAELFSDLATMRNQLQQATGNFRLYLLREIPRLENLVDLFPRLVADSAGLKEMHQLMVNTPYYDEINMGTENFVVACFQNFLLRYPSQMELENASDMVNGSSAQLFLQSGSHKEDFIEIFFNSPEYFEGQVRYHYLRYLFREPSPYELNQELQAYSSTEDYRNLIKKIIASDAYFYN